MVMMIFVRDMFVPRFQLSRSMTKTILKHNSSCFFASERRRGALLPSIGWMLYDEVDRIRFRDHVMEPL